MPAGEFGAVADMAAGELAERLRRKWWARQWRELYASWSVVEVPEDAFEAWLIEKWLRQIRSPAFRASVQGQQLIAEWERG